MQTSRRLELVASDENEFSHKFVSPFPQGVTIDGNEHKTDRDAEVSKTYLLVRPDMATEARTAPAAAAAAVVGAAVANAATGCAIASSVTPADPTATTLSSEDWLEGTSNWAAQRQGDSRVFRQNELCGAERIFARLRYQKSSSRNWSPLFLTEVDGHLNMKASARRQDTVARGLVRQIGQEIPEDSGDGRTVNLSKTAMTGLRANARATRWAAYGTEESIVRYEGFWKQLIHTKGLADLYVFQNVYTAAGARAYDMKGGSTYDRAVEAMIERGIEHKSEQAVDFKGGGNGGKDGKLADGKEGDATGAAAAVAAMAEDVTSGAAAAAAGGTEDTLGAPSGVAPRRPQAKKQPMIEETTTVILANDGGEDEGTDKHDPFDGFADFVARQSITDVRFGRAPIEKYTAAQRRMAYDMKDGSTHDRTAVVTIGDERGIEHQIKMAASVPVGVHPPADDEWNCCQCGEDLMLSGYNPRCHCGHSQCDTCHIDNMPDPYCDCCRPLRPGGPPRRPPAAAAVTGLRPPISIAVEKDEDCRAAIRFELDGNEDEDEDEDEDESFETFGAERAANVIQSTLSTYLNLVPAGEYSRVGTSIAASAESQRSTISSTGGPASGRSEQVFQSIFSATADSVADLSGELNIGGGGGIYELIPIIETIAPKCAGTAAASVTVAKNAEGPNIRSNPGSSTPATT